MKTGKVHELLKVARSPCYNIPYGTVKCVCLDGCPSTFFIYSPTVVILFLIPRRLGQDSVWLALGGLATAAANIDSHAPMRPQMRTVAVLGRAHTKFRASRRVRHS
jgi:hypothetical protein